MRHLITLVTILSFSVPAFAQNVQKILKGIPSPVDGWVVTDEFMQKAARDKKILDAEKQKSSTLQEKSLLLEQKGQSLERQIDLANGEAQFFEKQYKETNIKLEQSENGRFWSNMGHFVLGVFMTGVAAKAAIESSK